MFGTHTSRARRMGNKRARGSVSDCGPIRIIKHEAVPQIFHHEHSTRLKEIEGTTIWFRG